MPNYWPLSSGNWSNLSNWLTSTVPPVNAGVLPTPTDDVYANNRIIYIDNNYQVSSIRNISATNIAQGGYFVLNDGFTLSAFVFGGGVTEVACLQFLSAAPASATLVGNLCAGDPSAPVLRPIAFENVSTGSFTIRGNSLGGFNNNSAADVTNANNGIIINDGNGNLTLIGTFSGDVRTGSSALVGIRNNGTGNIFLTGNVFGGASTGSQGLRNVGSGNVFLSGNVIAGTGASNIGIVNVAGGNVFVLGDVVARAAASSIGIQNAGTTGTVSVTGRITGGSGSSATGISNTSTGTVNVSGNIVGSSGGGGLSNSGNGNAFIFGNLTGSTAFALSNSGGSRSSVVGAINVRGISNSGTGSNIFVVGPVTAGSFAEAINNSSTGTVNITGAVTGGTTNSNFIVGIVSSGTLNVSGSVAGGSAVGGTGGYLAGINPTGGSVNIIGTVRGGNAGSSNSGGAPNPGIYLNTSNIPVTIRGQVLGGTGTGNIVGIWPDESVVLNISIIGDVIGGNSTGASIAGDGIFISRSTNTGVINITGNVIGGVTHRAILHSSNFTITVSGNVTGGTGANGIDNVGPGRIRVSGTASAGTGGHGINNTGTNSTVEVRRAKSNDFGFGSTGITFAGYGVVGTTSNITIVEELESGARGLFPTSGNVYIRRTSETIALYRDVSLNSVTMFTSLSGSTSLNPLPKDVRRGVTYDYGALVGTLDMPSPATVNAGVPVDNTVGTGVFTPIGVWSFPISAIPADGNMGTRVKNSATIDSIGNLITNLS